MYTRVLQTLDNHQAADAKEATDLNFVKRCLSTPGLWFGQSNLDAHLTGSAIVMDEAN